MEKLSRIELAIVKRVAQNVKSFKKRKAVALKTIEELREEVSTLNKTIADFESPIINKYGYDSETILSGGLNTDKIVEFTEPDKTNLEEEINSEYTNNLI